MPDTSSKDCAGGCGDELSDLLECLLDPLFLIDPDSGLITACNAAALRWQGCERSALVGQHCRILLPDSEDGSRHDLLERTRVHGNVFMEQPFALRGGSTARADLSASLWHRAAGDVIVIVLRDAEQRLAAQLLENEARLAAARLETLSRLSHEINNQLQALVMHEGPEFDDEVKGHIDQIVAAMSRMRAGARGLPVEPEAFIEEPLEPAGVTRAPADVHRVLFADDSDSIRRSLGLLLRHALPDSQVDLAADGEEAIACFKRGHPAVMVLDIQMPRKTGDQVVEEIVAFCRQEHWEEPRIAFCTGFTPPPGVQAVLEPPSRHVCLLKPVPPRDLLAAVEGLLAAARRS